MRAAQERLEVLDGLLRAADHEAVVFRIVDLSLSNTEAEWALTNIGSEAFRGHGTFATVDTGPFSPLQAKAIVRTKSLAAEKPKLLVERDETRRELERLEVSVQGTPLFAWLVAELEQMVTAVRRG
jgi:hypothetical protein